MKKVTIVLIGNLLICISVVSSLGLVVMLKPTSYKVLILLGAWMIIPYFLFAYFVNFRSKTFRQALENVVMSCLCSLGGIYMIVDSMFIHSDPQGGFVVIFTPLLQIGGFLLLRFLVMPENR